MMRTRLKMAAMIPALSVLLSGCCLTQGDSVIVCVDDQHRREVNERNSERLEQQEEWRDRTSYQQPNLPGYDWDN